MNDEIFIKKIRLMKNIIKYNQLWLLFVLCLVMGSSSFGQGIRKHYTEMTNQERIAYKNVMTSLDNDGTREYYANLHNNPDQGDDDGNGPGSESWDQIHGILEFLSWHRQFIREFEWQIQSYADYLTIPYWDWTGESDPPGINSASIDGPLWANNEIATLQWTDNFLGSFDFQFGLTRSLGVNGSMPTATEVDALYSLPNINVFHENFEAPIHNPPHMWVGGQMGTPDSPRDPVFYFHHAMVDKIWQNWTEIPGHNSGFDDDNMPTWSGNVDDFPYINQNTLVDSRSLGIFYSNAAAGKTTMEAYTVTNNVRPVEKFNYQYKIEAKNGFTVPAGKNAVFRSCNKIVLGPGFHAIAGASFLAKIDADCDFSTFQMVNQDKDILAFEGNERNSNEVSEHAKMSLRNYPNPFTYQTTVEYTLEKETEISISLYNLMGQKVRSLVDNQVQIKGTHGINVMTHDLPAGIYYCTWSGDAKTMTIPLMVNK